MLFSSNGTHPTLPNFIHRLLVNSEMSNLHEWGTQGHFPAHLNPTKDRYHSVVQLNCTCSFHPDGQHDPSCNPTLYDVTLPRQSYISVALVINQHPLPLPFGPPFKLIVSTKSASIDSLSECNKLLSPTGHRPPFASSVTAHLKRPGSRCFHEGTYYIRYSIEC